MDEKFCDGCRHLNPPENHPHTTLHFCRMTDRRLHHRDYHPRIVRDELCPIAEERDEIAALRAELAEKDAEIASLNTKLIDASNIPGVNNINFEILWKIKGDLEAKLAEKERECEEAKRDFGLFQKVNNELRDKVTEEFKKRRKTVSDLAACHKKLSLFQRAVGPVREADCELLNVMITDKDIPEAEQKRIAGMCVKAVRDCIRILGEDAAKG